MEYGAIDLHKKESQIRILREGGEIIDRRMGARTGHTVLRSAHPYVQALLVQAAWRIVSWVRGFPRRRAIASAHVRSAAVRGSFTRTEVPDEELTKADATFATHVAEDRVVSRLTQGGLGCSPKFGASWFGWQRKSEMGLHRIQGALKNVGRRVARSTIASILKAAGIPPSRERPMTWRTFLHAHWPALIAADFFTTEVWTVRGLVTYYTVFVIELQSRRVHVAGSTPFPDEAFVLQGMRSLANAIDGVLANGCVLICDRD